MTKASSSSRDSESSSSSDLESSSSNDAETHQTVIRKPRQQNRKASALIPRERGLRQIKRNRKPYKTYCRKVLYLCGEKVDKKDPSFGDALPHCSSSLKQPPFFSPSNSAAHDSLCDDVPSVISPEALDDLRRQVQKT
ncbi:hypothetical protein OUZ56_024617 [Daphnia magna]|uniref:Uncharacterized protein n=1 Tax=Daphnia magna TaxID=35525 RepID=A0ABR0B179_9CRUS|nr:hypothetical protein OUZ56_024617 [Daphnia magna]